MDSSHTPRARIPNPNHHISAATHASLGPSTRQPAPQQPHFHRDPFRPPPSQPPRRDSSAPSGMFWSSSGPSSSYSPARRLHHRDTLQPAPPPPPSPFSRDARFLGDHVRRSSQNGDPAADSSTAGYAAHKLGANREMPPPASSPTRASPADVHSRVQQGTASKPYGSLRDALPRPAGRAANDMSISSVLGTETPSAHRASPWSPQSKNVDQPGGDQPPASPHQAPLPTFRQARIPLDEPSPRYGPIFSTPQHPGPPYQSSPYSSDPTKPDTSRTPNSARGAQLDTVLPPRPYSQPVGDPSGELDRRHGTLEDHITRTDGTDMSSGRLPNGRQSPRYFGSAGRSRDRASSDLSPRVLHKDLRSQDTAAFAPLDYAQKVSQPRDSWRPHDNLDLGDADRPIASREGPQLPPDMVHGPQSLPPSNQDEVYQLNGGSSRLLQVVLPADERQPHTSIPKMPVRDELASRGPYLDQHLRKAFDDSQTPHRASVVSSHDGSRRPERASPLPQAVQGASSQPVGSGRDPSIKSEFTRVFSGLGSGVGSTPVPMAQTSSPTPAKQATGESNAYDEQLHDPRHYAEHGVEYLPKSQSGRRAKRNWDTDGKLGSDTEVRKRKTLAHHHHHHHHGLNGPRPHHHHLKPDEVSAGPYRRQSSDTPLAALKSSTSSAVAAPNRHHHHNIHHHHHGMQSGTTPVPLFRRPCVTIKTQPLLQSVSQLSRCHLGSWLYDMAVQSAPSRATPLRAQTLFSASSQVLPSFKNKENCTYTVRVPRFFLSAKSRESICARRQVWGTDVYTDDSDPLAATIHSGWIRGAWSTDVDVSLLDLHLETPVLPEPNVTATSKHSPTHPETLTEPPAAGPVTPPQDYDAHITLLLLPPLEKYTASTWHGIRSRAWGDTHDGMSYKIHKVEWVNKGSMTPLSDRTADARNERLRQRLRTAPQYTSSSKAGLNKAPGQRPSKF